MRDLALTEPFYSTGGWLMGDSELITASIKATPQAPASMFLAVRLMISALWIRSIR